MKNKLINLKNKNNIKKIRTEQKIITLKNYNKIKNITDNI